MATSKRPNILLISSDQQHWNTLGVLNAEVKTPNLDRLAARGMLFERAYCPNPTCTPTRASIITGMHPSQHGAYSLGTKLDERVPTLGAALAGAGYATALVGKAHFQQLISTEKYPSLESYPILRDLDFWKNFEQPFYGFDHVELARNHADEAHVGQHYAIWMEQKGLKDWKKHFQNKWHGQTSEGVPVDFQDPDYVTSPQEHRWTLPEEFHYNTWIAERSNALMEQCVQKDQPFFLWSSFFDPHPPYLIPEPWDTMYDPQTVTVPELVPGEHDRNPQHFRQTQEAAPDFTAWAEPGGNAMHGCSSHRHTREEMAKNIAIYYGMVSCMDKYIGQILDKLDELGIADNTLIVFTSDHGHFFGQHGLIAKGPFHYEDLLKVPMIVSWPGQIPMGERSTAMQSLVDLAPTFLSAAGQPKLSGMTGLDQLPSWKSSDAQVREQVIVENRHQPTTIHVKTLVTDRYKLTVYRGRDYGEIFDLQVDPNELANLWNDPAGADLKHELTRQLLDATMAIEPLPMPRISVA